MRYEEAYRKKQHNRNRRPSRRRRGPGRWLAELCLRLVALALVLALLGAGLLYALPVSLLAVEREGADLSLTDGLPQDRANILLLGLDATRQNSRRSDSIMIASVGYGALKLTSVLRDTLVDIPGHGVGKLNAAYAHGGAQLVMKTLNQTLRLNLMHYVAVDYRTFADAVDALGGVELEITEAEMNKINLDIGVDRDRYAALGYTAPDLTQCGEDTHLNGLQALTFARIRKLDSDFNRSARQRRLLAALLKKLRASLWNPVVLSRLARVVFASADTDLSPLQLLLLASKALAAGPPEQLRLPVEGSYTDDGSSLQITDPQLNIGAFQSFVWGK